MNRDAIHQFLRVLGVPRVAPSVAGDEWVNSSCPLASVLHKGGRDERPSFGILINDKGESLYHCFTCCPTAAPLSGLVHTLWISSSFRWAEAMQAYGKLEIFGEYKKPIDAVIVPTKEPCYGVLSWVLNRYPLLADASGFEAKRCIEYLGERGISLETIEKFQLRYGKDQQVIVFPRMDKQDRVWALRARSRKTKDFFSISPKYMLSDTQWGDTSRWFGEQFLTDDPVTLVESETDVLRLAKLGVSNVLASCGQVQKAQLKRLYHIVIILGFDADRPGQQMAYRAAYHLKDTAVLYLLDWSLVGCKDAGNLKSLIEYKQVFGTKTLLNKG